MPLSVQDVTCLTDAQMERIFGSSNRLAVLTRLPMALPSSQL